MNVNDLFPGAINAASIEEPKEYTVKSWDLYTFPAEPGAEPDRAVRIFFEGTERYVVLNGTRRQAMCDLYGSDADQWTGSIITIQRGKTLFQGKPIDCVEIAGPSGENPFD